MRHHEARPKLTRPSRLLIGYSACASAAQCTHMRGASSERDDGLDAKVVAVHETMRTQVLWQVPGIHADVNKEPTRLSCPFSSPEAPSTQQRMLPRPTSRSVGARAVECCGASCSGTRKRITCPLQAHAKYRCERTSAQAPNFRGWMDGGRLVLGLLEDSAFPA